VRAEPRAWRWNERGRSSARGCALLKPGRQTDDTAVSSRRRRSRARRRRRGTRSRLSANAGRLRGCRQRLSAIPFFTTIPTTANDQKSGENLDLYGFAQPARRELLKQIGVSFEMLCCATPARGPDVDESQWRTTGRHYVASLPRQIGRGLGRVCQRRLRRFRCRGTPSSASTRILSAARRSCRRGAHARRSADASTACHRGLSRARIEIAVSESRVRFCELVERPKPTSRADKPTKRAPTRSKAAPRPRRAAPELSGSWAAALRTRN